MAYSTIGTVNWGSGPVIPVTFSYDYKRSGANMQYKIKISVAKITGSSYFGYPIYATITLDGATKVSGHTMKNADPSQWSDAIVYESEWLTVDGKASGTTELKIRIRSGSGSKRDNTYRYNLDVSPTASVPTVSVSSVDMGIAVTINTNRASSDFTHALSYSFGSLSNQTDGLSASSNVDTSATFTAPLALASQIPNGTSGICTITCDTYEGSTLIGTKTVSLTLNVPTSVVPTISAVSISEATSGLAAKFATYVQNKSTLAVAITAAGSYGSTIENCETYIQSVLYRGSSFTSDVIAESGTIGIVTTVTDSRGRTAQVTNTITVLAYSPPVINSMSAFRITSGGVASDDGDRIAVSMNFAISSVNNLNNHTYALKYKRSTDTDFTTFSSGTASWSYDDTQYFTNSPDISTDYAYVIRIEIADYFQTVSREVQIPTAFTIVDLRNTGKGIAFGKVSEKDCMEIAMDVDLTGEFVQEERQTPILKNSWVNYGDNYESASYWIDKCGVVHIAGIIKSGATAAETVIFNLPAGYRPRLSEKFFAVSLDTICVIDVYSSGDVVIKSGANSGWLSLSGINFRAN